MWSSQATVVHQGIPYFVEIICISILTLFGHWLGAPHRKFQPQCKHGIGSSSGVTDNYAPCSRELNDMFLQALRYINKD